MSSFFAKRSFKFKLVFLVIGVSIFSILITSILSSRLLKIALNDSARLQIESMGSLISGNAQSSLNNAKSFSEKLSRNRLVEGMFLAYESAFYGAAFFPGEDLQIYSDSYKKLDDIYHERFLGLINDLKFKNVLLVSKEGQVILSSLKDAKGDYLGRNLVDGNLKGTPLKNCFETALGSSPNTAFFTGFFNGPYGVTSFFCTKQVAEFDHPEEGIDKGDLMGVIISEFSHKVLNEVTLLGNVLGSSAQAILIGEDSLLRNDPRNTEDFNISKSFSEKTSYDQLDINKVKKGHEIKTVSNGVVSRYYKPFTALGKKYALILEKSEVEILAPIATVNKFSFLGGLIIFMIAAVIGFVVAKRISLHISKSNHSLTGITEEIDISSHRNLTSSEELKESSDRITEAISRSSSSMHELSQMISRTLESVSKSEENSKRSSQSVESGLSEVDKLADSISSVEESNKNIFQEFKEMSAELEGMKEIISKISDKTNFINDIVFQTKLLSFNASVEAARAGEHGKGFAVVAEEIGHLAQSSGMAAEEINKMVTEGKQEVENIVQNIVTVIDRSSSETENKVSTIVEAVNECKGQFNSIMEQVRIVDSHIQEIFSASREQKVGVEEIEEAMKNLSEIAQKTNTIAMQSNHSAQDQIKKVSMLNDLKVDLNNLVNGAGNGPVEVPEQTETKLTLLKTGDDEIITEEEKETVVAAQEPVIEKKAVGHDSSIPDENDSRFEDL